MSSSIQKIPKTPPFSRHIKLASDEGGNVIAVWSGGGERLAGLSTPMHQLPYYSFKLANTSFTNALPLDTIFLSYPPQIAMDSKGNALAVWVDENTNIRYSYKPRGSSFTKVQLIENSKALSCMLAFSPNDEAYLIWTSYVNSAIFFSNLTKQTLTFEDPILITNGEGWTPHFSISFSQDNSAIIWAPPGQYAINPLISSEAYQIPYRDLSYNHIASDPYIFLSDAKIQMFWLNKEVNGSKQTLESTSANFQFPLSFEQKHTLLSFNQPGSFAAGSSDKNIYLACATENSSLNLLTFDSEQQISTQSEKAFITAPLNAHSLAITKEDDVLICYEADNQIGYSLFKEGHSNSQILGKGFRPQASLLPHKEILIAWDTFDDNLSSSQQEQSQILYTIVSIDPPESLAFIPAATFIATFCLSVVLWRHYFKKKS